ncbi:MAG: hypothetical protein GY796_09900 [Chloroflexi bacterium]|nr:hypothetical protein [Chloroflexota bacterium]
MVKKWEVQDRFRNIVYFTEERWEHILESHPELEPHFDKLLETLRTGQRKQDALFPNEYRYYKRFDELMPENNHIIVIVIFKTTLDEHGRYLPNNFVVTGWAKYIWPKR